MKHEIHIELSFPGEPDVGRVKALMSISERRLVVLTADPLQRRLVRKYVPFRGPRFLQGILTLPAALIGTLLSKRDLAWMGTNTGTPSLLITPIVPREFWLEIHFRNRQDAAEVTPLIDNLWR